MIRKLMAVIMGVAAAWSAGAEVVICEAESPATFVDSRHGIRYDSGTNAVHTLNWNAAWVGGDASVEVVIADGNTELARVTGAGSCTWTNAVVGLHTLTYTTFIDGVAQPEVYTAAYFCLGEAGVSHVTARRILPWAGLVEISYDLSEGVEALSQVTNLLTQVRVTDHESGEIRVARTFARAPTYERGRHVLIWDAAADDVSFKTASASFSVAVTDEVVEPLPLYRVIDVSAGADAARYPVIYRDDVPTAGWTDVYKADKIVLRRIDGMNGVYYAGVFEITEAQWDKVMGGSSASTTPKGSVSYNTIRGDADYCNWPHSDAVGLTSFMGWLRQKTGLSTLDLPSEAEWEYAARAGVTTKWLCGDSETGLGDYAWYCENSGSETHPVAQKAPNAWGLYDVHGNVWEWCLNRYPSDYVDGYRVLRGGSYDDDASICAFASRDYNSPSSDWYYYGFRLFCRPESESSGSSSEAFFSGTSVEMPLDLTAVVLKVGESVGLEYSPLFSTEPCDTVCLVEVTAGVTNLLCESATAGVFAWSSQEVSAHSFELVFLKDGIEAGARRVVSAEVWDDSIVLDRVDMPLRQLLPTACGYISHITLAEGVTEIPYSFFEGCTNLASVTIPASVTRIGGSAFEGCGKIQSVVFGSLPQILGLGEGNADGYLRNLFPDSCATLTNVTLGAGVTELPDGFFDGCDALESVTFPETLTDFGDNDLRAVGARAGRSGLWVQDGWVLGYLGEAPATVVIPDGMKGIAAHAFADQVDIESVAFPDTLEYVGVEAFRRCTGLSVIDLPDGVVRVDDGAFQDCTYVKSFAAPASLRAVGAAAFANAASLDKVTFVNGLLDIGPAAFSNAWRMLSVSLPVSVTNVGRNAFWNCKNLAGVTTPTHLAPLAEIFPAAYDKLTSVAVADGETALAPSIFAGCAALETVELPAVIDNVPDAAFRDCTSLRQIVFPAIVTNVGAEAFAGCASLASFDFPKGLRSIGDKALSGCASLSEIGIPVGLSVLGTGIFRDCAALMNVDLPEDLSELPDELFAGCSSLPSIVVPASVTRLGVRVFAGCTALRSVLFLGNAPTADAAAYEDAPAALVTYVADGTRGWDGIETSRNLPETWPAGAPNAIAAWTPTRLNVTFDARGGEPAETVIEETAGARYLLPQPDPSRLGATFLGWWTEPDAGEEVRPTTCVLLADDHTLYAHWRLHGYTVAFDANGGVGEMAPVARTVGTAAALPPAAFRRDRYDFAGWALSPDGKAAFADGADPGDLAYGDGDEVTLYAVWRERAWTAADWLDAPGLAFSCAGDADWRPDAEESHDGVGSMRSGTLGTAPKLGTTVRSTLKAVVRGRGVLLFWWKVVCEPGDSATGDLYDYLELTVDGKRPASVDPIAGETGWARVEVRIDDASAHEVAWSFVKDDWDEAVYADAAWVDEVSWTPDAVTLSFDGNGATGGTAPEPVSALSGEEVALPGPGTLVRDGCRFVGWSDGGRTYAAGEAYVAGGADVTFAAVWKELSVGDVLDAPGLAFAAGGDAKWVIDSAVSHDGAAALRSGAVEVGQSCWIETSVAGAGTLTFWWKAEGLTYRGKPANYVDVSVDGVVAATAVVTNWTLVMVQVEGSGAHTVRWTYRQTRAQEAGRAWLDEVAWTPAPTAPGVVGDEGATVTGDAEGGFTVTPGARAETVEVTVPDGLDAAKVTVSVPPTVKTVKVPTGVKVKVMRDGHDITAFLDIPKADASGAVDLASATVKDEIVQETLDTGKDAEIRLGDPSEPTLKTAPTKPGLVYTLREGATLDAMKDGDWKVGDGQPWTPAVKVKGGASGFYSIRVSK